MLGDLSTRVCDEERKGERTDVRQGVIEWEEKEAGRTKM